MSPRALIIIGFLAAVGGVFYPPLTLGSDHPAAVLQADRSER